MFLLLSTRKKKTYMKKIKLCGLLIGSALLMMVSCLRSDDVDISNWMLGNAQISSFSLSHDSIEGLSDVKFTIDQVNSLIFNKDSMPYGTAIDRKVICDLNFDNLSLGVANVLFIQHTGDSVWGTSDSIDFSQPVKIVVYPYDGVSTKTYDARLNVHQVNPDTLVWQQYADLLAATSIQDMKVVLYKDAYYIYVRANEGSSLYTMPVAEPRNPVSASLSGFPDDPVFSQIVAFEDDLYVLSKTGDLFCSPDGQSWSPIEGAPSLKALLGSLPENTVTKRASVLVGLTANDGDVRSVSMTKDGRWQIGSSVPEAFPLSGFGGGVNYEAMYYPRLVIVGGRSADDQLSNEAWNTTDGLSWSSLTNVRASFSPREGAAVSFYDDCIFLIGGIDAGGIALKDIYYSRDKGINWSTDGRYVMPDAYRARSFSSVIVDENNYMTLFGGKAETEDTYVLNELWRGRINRLGFGKD
jgi:hypothetical protein